MAFPPGNLPPSSADLTSSGSAPQSPSKAPCGSCPYRRDVPSGLWEAHEYSKLPGYDGEIVQQLMAGAMGLFFCHQNDGHLCSGWVGCHGAENLLATRLHAVSDETFDYQSPVPLFASGAQAAAHGMARIENPDKRAVAAIQKLERKLPMQRDQNRRSGRGPGPTPSFNTEPVKP